MNVINRMYLDDRFKKMEVLLMNKKSKYLVMFLIKGSTRDVLYSVAFNSLAESESYWKGLDEKQCKEICSFLVLLGERSKKI